MASLSAFICKACGTQFPESEEPPRVCPICQDARQYIPSGGQEWTSLEKLSAAHRNSVRQYERDVFGLGTEPSFAIGQRTLILRVERPPRPRRASTKSAPAPIAANGQGEGPSPDRALEMVSQTLEALRAERGEDYEIRGSLIKQTIKRRNPGFNERAHGFRAFNELLLEAQKRGLLKLEADKQAGTYIVRPVD